MKHLFLSFAILMGLIISAQDAAGQGFVYTEASDLTLTGKLHTDTPNPYHRVDTVKYKGFTPGENLQVRMSSGIAVAFMTNSSAISIKTVFGKPGFPTNTNGYSGRGYDLYIRQDGEWIYAESGLPNDSNPEKPFTLISHMDKSMKECLLYLPLYSEVNSVQIGVDKEATLEAMENPFRHRIGVFGSSYTHGSSTSRGGMTYIAQLSRNTGLQMLSLGCSGNSKLQPYFAAVLRDADVDAFLFDSFSNPTPKEMKERLFNFIETIQAAHPGKPLIFQRTIYRESRNFNMAVDKSEREKIETADSLMKIAMKKYPDIYYIFPKADTKDHNATVDGTHPDNRGYTVWAESIEKPVRKILKKYGIR
jgi:hypothetical protein